MNKKDYLLKGEPLIYKQSFLFTYCFYLAYEINQTNYLIFKLLRFSYKSKYICPLIHS
nr:MAG TPA: hypothetical protein [Caudoviricetes sp.]